MVCILKILGASALNQHAVLRWVVQDSLVIIYIIDLKLIELLILNRLIQIAGPLHLIFHGQLLWIVDIRMQNLRRLIGLLVISHSQYLLRRCILILLTLIDLLLLNLWRTYGRPSWASRYLRQHWLLLIRKAMQLRWWLLIYVQHLIVPLLLMYLAQVLILVVLGLAIVKRGHVRRNIGGLGLIWLIYQVH